MTICTACCLWFCEWVLWALFVIVDRLLLPFFGVARCLRRRKCDKAVLAETAGATLTDGAGTTLGSVAPPSTYGASSGVRDVAVAPDTTPARNGRKIVVIVGASFGGLSACHQFADDPRFHVVLIDQREYFEYTPGVLRLFCQPGLLHTMARKLPRGSHELILGQVTSVARDHVVVGGQRRIEFDYLILATGADYRQPVTPALADSTLAARSKTWHQEAARVRAATSVLILGGGAVGTELAAEIVCHFPEKRLTIVDALPNLVPLFPRKTIEKAESWFRDRGVELVLGELLEKWDDSSCTTQSGRVIEADIVYVCFGMRCNSQSVAKGDLASCLGKRQEVQVNEFFQIEDHSNIFAIGDVMVHPSREIKQAYYAEMNGKAAALNVIRHSQGDALLKYPEALGGADVNPLVYVVSLGRYDGSLGFNKLVLSGASAALLKWVIEWTKVAQMEERPVGIAVWAVGDAVSFWLSRTLIRPEAKDRDN